MRPVETCLDIFRSYLWAKYQKNKAKPIKNHTCIYCRAMACIAMASNNPQPPAKRRIDLWRQSYYTKARDLLLKGFVDQFAPRVS